MTDDIDIVYNYTISTTSTTTTLMPLEEELSVKENNQSAEKVVKEAKKLLKELEKERELEKTKLSDKEKDELKVWLG